MTTTADLKTLPHNIEAETAVLGSLIIDPDAIALVADMLKATDFYRTAHSLIYRELLAALKRGEPADFILLCSSLESQSRLEDAGGAAYITSLVSGVPTSGNVEYYARVVMKLSLLRRLIGYAARVAQGAYEGNAATAETVLSLAHELLAELDIPSSSASALQSHPDGMSEYLTKLSQLYDHRRDGLKITGQATGYPTLDFMTGGLQRGDLIVLAARPSVGKSALMLNIAKNAIEGGAVGLIFSLEMSREQLWQRLLSELTGIDQARLRTGNIDDRHFQVGTEVYDGEWSLIVERVNDIVSTSGTLFVDDTSVISPARMRIRAERLQAQIGRRLDFIMIDYLQLARLDASDAGNRFDNRVQEVSAITKDLKKLARDLDVPVVALAQLNRAAEGIEPQLSHLKESGAIEEDADIVLFMWLAETAREIRAAVASRNAPMPAYPVEMKIAKHRKGSVGFIPLVFQPWMTHFDERNTDGFTEEEESA